MSMRRGHRSFSPHLLGFICAAVLAACSGGNEEPGGTGGATASGGQNDGTPGSGGQTDGDPGSGGQTNGDPGSGGTGDPATGGQTSGDLPTGTPVEQALPDLLSVRQEHPVVALDGSIYVIGGFDPDLTSSVEAYDVEAESWRSVQSFPYAVHHANAEVIDGKIIVAGFFTGNIGNSQTSSEVYAYDPNDDEWTPRTSMPAGSERASACTAVLGNRMYLFGGARASTVADASAYDAQLDEWFELPPLPEPREHCVAAAVGDTLYILAGRQGGIFGLSEKTFAFNPTTEMYQEVAPIPTPRGGVAGSALGGRIYVFGGEGNADVTGGMFDDVEAYDPAADEWHVLAPMQVPRHGFGGATLGGRIYLAGGATNQGLGAVADHSVFFYE